MRDLSRCKIIGSILKTCVVVISSVLALGFANTAWADDLIDVSGDCLKTQTVCLYPPGTIADPVTVIQSLPNGVRVLVVPQESVSPMGTMSADQVAQALLSQLPGTHTIIVVVDAKKDRFGFASASLDRTTVLTALNSASTSDGGEAIVKSTEVLIIETPTVEPSQKRIPTLAAIALVVVAILLAVGISIIVSITRKTKQSNQNLRVDRRLFGESEHGDSVEKSLLKLRDLIWYYGRNEERYSFTSQTGDKVAASELVLNVVVDTQELFKLLEEKGTNQQHRLATITYDDVLKKLLLGVDKTYLGDILDRPRFWDNPPERLLEVGNALIAVHTQILDNIKQLNASRDLDFKVALDSLVDSTKQTKLSDLYDSVHDGGV